MPIRYCVLFGSFEKSYSGTSLFLFPSFFLPWGGADDFIAFQDFRKPIVSNSQPGIFRRQRHMIQVLCLPARRENKAQTLPVAHELSFHIEVLSENSH